MPFFSNHSESLHSVSLLNTDILQKLLAYLTRQCHIRCQGRKRAMCMQRDFATHSVLSIKAEPGIWLNRTT